MKTRIIVIITIVLIGLVIIFNTTKPKVELWLYEKLPNDYVIEKITETKMVIGKKNNKKIGLEKYIAEFSYGKKYISLKCIDPNKEENTVDVSFYIIDTLNETIYGPYNLESKYLEAKEKIVDENLSKWIKTIETPDDAIIK